MRLIEPHFPRSHGVIFVIQNGLRWRDAPKEYGPHKTI
jgi:putative transposase